MTLFRFPSTVTVTNSACTLEGRLDSTAAAISLDQICTDGGRRVGRIELLLLPLSAAAAAVGGREMATPKCDALLLHAVSVISDTFIRDKKSR